MKKGRRYIITVPLNYNPDQHGHKKPIEEEKIIEIEVRVQAQFGGFTRSQRTEPFTGCFHEYEDKVELIIVDDWGVDLTIGQRFFEELKEFIKRLLNQKEIYIVFHDIWLI